MQGSTVVGATLSLSITDKLPEEMLYQKGRFGLERGAPTTLTKEQFTENLSELIHDIKVHSSYSDDDRNADRLSKGLNKLTLTLGALADDPGLFKTILLAPFNSKNYMSDLHNNEDKNIHAFFYAFSSRPDLANKFLDLIHQTLGKEGFKEVVFAKGYNPEAYRNIDESREAYQMLGYQMNACLPKLFEYIDNNAGLTRQIANFHLLGNKHSSSVLNNLIQSPHTYQSEADRNVLATILRAFTGYEKELGKLVQNNTGSNYYECSCHSDLMLVLIDKFRGEPDKLMPLVKEFYGRGLIEERAKNDGKFTKDEVILYSMAAARKNIKEEYGMYGAGREIDELLTKLKDVAGFPVKEVEALSATPLFSEKGQLRLKQTSFFEKIKPASAVGYSVPPKTYEEQVAAIESLAKINTLVSKLDPDHLHITKEKKGLYISPLVTEILISSGKSWQELRDKLKPYDVNSVKNISDTVDDFTRLVLLPKTMQILKPNEPGQTVGSYSIDKMVEQLRLPAFKALFMAEEVKVGSSEHRQPGRDIETILRLSQRWHDRTLDRLMRDQMGLESGPRWHPIMEPKVIEIPDGKYKGWKLKNLTLASELHKQHDPKNMGTCIQSFVGDCLSAEQHVILFEDPKGQSRAYVRMGFREDEKNSGRGFAGKGLKIVGFRGRQNQNQVPDEDSRGVLNWFEQHLSNGSIKLLTKEHGDSRPEEERKKSDDVKEAIGFNYADNKKRQEIFDVFCCKRDNPFGDALKVGGEQTFVRLPKHLNRSMGVDDFISKRGLLDAICDTIKTNGFEVNHSVMNSRQLQ